MDLTKLDDEKLVKDALSGDALAFEKLVGKYFGSVYALCLAQVRHKETAEDLTQEVFLRAYLFLQRLQTGAKFGPWLSQIAHNISIDWFRKRQRKSEIVPQVCLDDIAEIIPEKNEGNAREIMKNKEHDEALRKAIFALPIEQREIVLLRFAENLQQNEIARRLSVSPPTVHRHLKKALANMKGSLEPILSETAPSLRPSGKVAAKTLAAIVAASAMSNSARAALAEAAGGTAWISTLSAGSAVSTGGTVGVVKTIGATLAKGASTIGMGKSVALLAIATAVIAGGGYYLHGNHDNTIQKVHGVRTHIVKPGSTKFLSWARSPQNLLCLLGEKGFDEQTPESEDTLELNLVILPTDTPDDIRKSFERISVREDLDDLLVNAKAQSVLKLIVPRSEMSLSLENHGGYSIAMDGAIVLSDGSVVLENLSFKTDAPND